MLPAMVVAFILSIIALFINDQLLPKSQFEVRKTVQDILVKKPAAYLEEGKFIKAFKGYVIFTKAINGNELKDVTIYQPQEEGKAIRTIVAERGEIVSDPVKKTIALKLYNGTSDEVNSEHPDQIYKLDFESFVLPSFDVSGSTSDLKKKIKDMTIDELVSKLRQKNPELKQQTEVVTRFETEIHKKIAFSFAPFVFAMIGLPLAIITKRGEAFISFLLAMGIVAVYYILFVCANTISIKGVAPPGVLLWLPNLLMIGASFFLFTKAVRL
jgi:lipopolysaccharide export system permease protein